jgi:hypothetical protein
MAHLMYSTIADAKKCAKKLKRELDDNGFDLPLHKCQLAIARSAGFSDWHDLDSAFKHKA